MTDLAVLVADKDSELSLCALLSRAATLGIRPVTSTFLRSQEHDPGVYQRATDLLRLHLRTHTFALVVLDREGSGRDALGRTEIEAEVEMRLSRNGWKDRCAAIVIDPELERWVWNNSQEMAATLGWTGKLQGLRGWLCEGGFLAPGDSKPSRPKEAMLAALRQSRVPRSSALFEQLALRVDTSTCVDPAFVKLRETLLKWFPLKGAPPENPRSRTKT